MLANANTGFMDPLAASNSGVTGNLLSRIGDCNQPIAANSISSVTVMAREQFTVGPLLIDVSNLTLTANAMWANGGGNEQHARTSWRINGGIGDASGVSFGGLPVRSVPQITGLQAGNGFTVIDTSSSNSAPCILSAGVKYNLWMEVETFISTLESGDIPRVAAANEFGQITAYRGYDISFSWRTVPAPVAAALASLGFALALARRRRRVPSRRSFSSGSVVLSTSRITRRPLPVAPSSGAVKSSSGR